MEKTNSIPHSGKQNNPRSLKRKKADFQKPNAKNVKKPKTVSKFFDANWMTIILNIMSVTHKNNEEISNDSLTEDENLLSDEYFFSDENLEEISTATYLREGYLLSRCPNLTKVIEHLLKNERITSTSEGGFKESLLHYIAATYDTQALKLLAASFDVNKPDKNGCTPLGIAIKKFLNEFNDQSFKIVQVLLENGAHVDKYNKNPHGYIMDDNECPIMILLQANDYKEKIHYPKNIEKYLKMLATLCLNYKKHNNYDNKIEYTELLRYVDLPDDQIKLIDDLMDEVEKLNQPSTPTVNHR